MMREEAAAGIAYLVAGTQGWNDEAIDVYVDQCSRFQDPGAFIVAMRNLALHWPKPTRPMMFDVNVAYQSETRNRELERGMLVEDTGPIVDDLEVGTEIARRAYYGECARQGKEPSDEIFDHWISVIGTKREDRQRRREQQARDDPEF